MKKLGLTLDDWERMVMEFRTLYEQRSKEMTPEQKHYLAQRISGSFIFLVAGMELGKTK